MIVQYGKHLSYITNKGGYFIMQNEPLKVICLTHYISTLFMKQLAIISLGCQQ